MKWRTVETVQAPDLATAKAALKLARKPITDALDKWRGQAEQVEAEWAGRVEAESTDPRHIAALPSTVTEYRSKLEDDGSISIQFREVDRDA